MRLRQTAIATGTTIILAATPALAAGLSTSQAAQASSQAAQAVGRQTHASSVKVTVCTRSSSRKAICHAEAHYSTGARRCTFDLTVIQASAKGQRPRTSPSNFVCY
jgi:predicted transglutaminase-like cysteine proteinase